MTLLSAVNRCAIIALLIAATSTALSETKRSYQARAEFIRENPCPSTGSPKAHKSCPGYIVDHIQALACGGLDHPSNMQWQTVEDAKAKDRWERKGCSK